MPTFTGLVKVIISGFFEIILNGSFGWNIQQLDKKQKITNLHGINRLYRPGVGRKPATSNSQSTPKWIVKIVATQMRPTESDPVSGLRHIKMSRTTPIYHQSILPIRQVQRLR